MDTDSASSRRQAALPILTSRLRIRPLGPGDVEAMHAVYSDSEVTRFIPGGVRDKDGTRDRVAELLTSSGRINPPDSNPLCGLEQ